MGLIYIWYFFPSIVDLQRVENRTFILNSKLHETVGNYSDSWGGTFLSYGAILEHFKAPRSFNVRVFSG